LYECLTGRRAFGGETVGDVLAAVLREEPDWSALPASTPAHVRALLARCLDKDPHTRLRDVGEARVALGSTPEPVLEPAPSRRTGVLVAAVLGVAVIAAVVSGVWRKSPTGPFNPLAGTTPRKLIDWPGTDFDAAISRDGKLFAFASDRGGQLDAWVGLIDGGGPRNVTRGSQLTWSLKVRDIYFDLEGASVCLSGGPLSEGTKRIDIMNGDERQSPLGKHVVNPAWSPDGTRVVFHLGIEGDPLYVADADGQNRTRISELEKGMHQHYPIWSSDGEWIYVSRGQPATHMDLWRISADGEVEEQLTSDKWDVAYPTPIDKHTVLFVAREEDGAGPWLWALDVETGLCERAYTGVERYLSIAASLDGRRLVATVANPAPHLLTVPILADRLADGSDVEQVKGLENEFASAPRFGQDGSLFFLSSGGVYRRRDGVVHPVLLAAEDAGRVPPAVSPEGDLLAVVSWKRGRPRLHVVSADGVVGPALSDTVDVQGAPAWSPRGDWIAVGGKDEDGEGLFRFKFPSDGTPPVRIADGHALNPVWSPAGDLIVYVGSQVMAFCPLLGITPDGTPVELPDIQMLRLGERMQFVPDGSGLVYMQGHQAAQDFWLLDLETLESRQLTRFEGMALVGEMRAFDVDPTGEFIVFDQWKLNSDIVLIER